VGDGLELSVWLTVADGVTESDWVKVAGTEGN